MSSVLGSLRKAREWAMPTLKQSAFLEKGVLTPEEFVVAGDELVYRCPTWTWESGDPLKRKAYLPDDKQYLMTRNVPCQNRVSSMETAMTMQAEGNDSNGDDGDDEWMISTMISAVNENDNNNNNSPPEDDFDIIDSEGEVVDSKPKANDDNTDDVTQQPPPKEEEEEEEDEYADMAAFEDDNVLQDDAAAMLPNSSDNNNNNNNNNDNDNVIKVRTYDLSITYDKYYQTPRVWMIGRDQQDQPLTATQMMQDVMSDYANKTVTMESHPHVSGPHASIHPCQHGKVMKAIVKNLMKNTPPPAEGDERPQGPTVEMYLFIFLKFVSSMIPTINYDFTMDVTADTTK